MRIRIPILIFVCTVLSGNVLYAQSDSGIFSWASQVWQSLDFTSQKFPYSQVPSQEFSGTQANQNVKKYWNLRNRLRNDFLLFSTEKGGCLPMEEVKILGDLRIGKWGDSTIKLGWYLGVLGSELHLLSRSDSYPSFGEATDLQNAMRELFCAFIALERLDRFGEQSIWEFHPIYLSKFPGTAGYRWPDTPGFFIRDDMTVRVMEQLRLNGGESDSENWYGNERYPTPPYNREMSQDQVVHLLLGLSIIKHLVPENYTYQGMNFKNQARSYARKLVDYVYDSRKVSLELFGVPIGSTSLSWMIENPVSPKVNWFGSCPACIGWFDPFHPLDPDHIGLVTRGQDARFFAMGFQQAGKWITDKDWYVSPAQIVSWSALSEVGAMSTPDNSHMTMGLAAIGNSWGEITPDVLMTQASQHDFYLYPLLNAVLHPENQISAGLEAKILSLLESVPWSGTGTIGFQGGWSSENRFIRRKEDHDKIPTGYVTQSHGLDFLLLHNLFYISKPNHFFGVTQNEQPAYIPDLSVPNWEIPPSYKLPPIGYAIQETPVIRNTCTLASNAEVPIRIEWEDPYGKRDTVRIELESQPSSGNGIVFSTGTKNKFLYKGKFWGQWWWEDSVRFKLTDEDENSTSIHLLVSYPGSMAAAPDIGAVGAPTRVVVNGWFAGIPLYGTIEMEFQVYSMDPNCVPPQPAPWLITGTRNTVAFPISPLRFRAIVGWTIFALHGNASVNLQAATNVGTTQTKEIWIEW